MTHANPPDSITLRAAGPGDVPAVAAVWHAAWQDGHLGHVPEALLPHRTLAQFEERVPARIPHTTVAVRGDRVVGFVTLREDELEQIFVLQEARGRGTARALLVHGERQIGRRFDTAWLAVVEGNAHARRFYERHGWRDAGGLDYAAEVRGGTIPVACRRYEKPVRAGARFRALHAGRDLFVMPNPWDAGTAHLLAGMGFAAIATSSAALAWTRARADATGAVTRDIAIAHARDLGEASGLPVNGDFESGYGATPDEVGETIRRAIDAGVAGCSIEDQDQSTGGLYPLDEARRRFAAARAAADRSGAAFVLTGRCEVFFERHEAPLAEAVRRLRAFEAAGADVVYAPGLTTEEEIAAVTSAVRVPVNVLGGIGGVSNDLAVLRRLGVKRVSIGSGLAKVALGGFLKAASALSQGRFDYEGATTSSALNDAFAPPRAFPER